VIEPRGNALVEEGSATSNRDLDIAILIPCLNEEHAIAGVVEDFRRALPSAAIYVYDNGSTDHTIEVARDAGAIVRHEPRRGKGNVVRRMFADIDADVYVMVDGDGTYDAATAPAMIKRLLGENLDMVIATRLEAEGHNFRKGHRAGNEGFARLIATLFGRQLTDVFSGYRAMTRRFVKSFPGYSSGFEIETELSVHALSIRIPMVEMPAPFGHRAPGSESKLSTFRDGTRILRIVFYFLKEVRPLLFFASLAVTLAIVSLALAYPVIVTYLETGLVPRFPTAILATGVMLLAFLFGACALILDSVAAMRWEAKRNAYLSEPLPPRAAASRF
jgi:glycosyltransferase involved in cell wall biosynthesis